jgi:hypothetical protein
MGAQVFLRLLEVLTHRLGGGFRITRFDGVENRFVLLDHVVDPAAARLMTGKAAPAAGLQRLGKRLDQEDEQPVAGRRRKVLVKTDVRRVKRFELLPGGAHCVDRHLHVGDLAAARSLCG